MQHQTELPWPAEPHDSTRLSFTITYARGQGVISVIGELDLTTSPGFAHITLSALGLPLQGLVIDLGSTAFLDAAAVTALVRVQRAAADAGIGLCLANMQPRVLRVLNLVNIEKLIPFAAAPTAAQPAIPSLTRTRSTAWSAHPTKSMLGDLRCAK